MTPKQKRAVNDAHTAWRNMTGSQRRDLLKWQSDQLEDGAARWCDWCDNMKAGVKVLPLSIRLMLGDDGEPEVCPACFKHIKRNLAGDLLSEAGDL